MKELGDELKKHVNKGTIFIEWSYGGVDFNLLSKGLSHFGFPDILGPGNKRSLPAIPTFKAAIPCVPSWRLDIVFQAWFPGSDLVGGNHNAPTDTRQLAKLLPLRFELAESLSGRRDRLRSIWPPHERGTRELSNQTNGNANINVAINKGAEITGAATLAKNAHAAETNGSTTATGDGEERNDFVRKMQNTMKEKGITHTDGTFTCNCGYKWTDKRWGRPGECEEHCRLQTHRSADPDDPYICVCGQLMPNAREDQGHKKFATHCAWSKAFDRIISGLLSEFTRKSKEIASLKADGEILIFDWRYTCGSLHQHPISGRNTITILLERHVQNACSLRRFAYVRQQDKPGYVCDCGKELEGKVNAAGKPLRLPEHKSKVHRSFLDCKNSECDECGLFIDNSIGKEEHLASRYHAFLKEISDDDRRQFLVLPPK